MATKMTTAHLEGLYKQLYDLRSLEKDSNTGWYIVPFETLMVPAKSAEPATPEVNEWGEISP